jgi:hypothetical protein
MSDAYVQVQFPGELRSYTYKDVSGKLQLGDQFELDPDNFDDRIVTVVSLERGYAGLLKQVNPINVKTNQAT